jgi:hypothetical protein
MNPIEREKVTRTKGIDSASGKIPEFPQNLPNVSWGEVHKTG